VTIASGQASPGALAIDATSVYWINTGDGTVKKAPLEGGPETTLVTDPSVPSALAVDGTNVYWIDSTSLMLVSVDGGAATIVTAAHGRPTALALDATHIYWADQFQPGTYAVRRIPK
jgi:sugar lactone lactonase YvrE